MEKATLHHIRSQEAASTDRGISRTGRRHTAPPPGPAPMAAPQAGQPAAQPIRAPLPAPMAPPLNVRCVVSDIPEQPPTNSAATRTKMTSAFHYFLAPPLGSRRAGLGTAEQDHFQHRGVQLVGILLVELVHFLHDLIHGFGFQFIGKGPGDDRRPLPLLAAVSKSARLPTPFT